MSITIEVYMDSKKQGRIAIWSKQDKINIALHVACDIMFQPIV